MCRDLAQPAPQKGRGLLNLIEIRHGPHNRGLSDDVEDQRQGGRRGIGEHECPGSERPRVVESALAPDAEFGQGLPGLHVVADRGVQQDPGAVVDGVSSRSRPAPSSIEARPMRSASMPTTNPVRAAATSSCRSAEASRV